MIIRCDNLLVAMGQRIMLSALLSLATGCGTEVGNGVNKKQPTTVGAGETNKNETPNQGAATNPSTTTTNTVAAGTSSASNTTPDSSMGPVGTASAASSSSPSAAALTDSKAMQFLLADCGSPFQDQITGTFKQPGTTDGPIFFNATVTGGASILVVFLTQYSYDITQLSAGALRISIADITSNTPTPVHYTCNNGAKTDNINYLGVTGVTKRTVELISGSTTGSVAWYLRHPAPGSSTGEVYRIEVTSGLSSQVYERTL